MSKKQELKTYPSPSRESHEGGPGSAGQSGDTQGLPDIDESGGESILELVQEGQNFEAEVLLGIAEADGDEGSVKRVRTKEVPQDDVPTDYHDTE